MLAVCCSIDIQKLVNIKELFRNAGLGYELSFEMVNACDYNVPQDRKRVFFIDRKT